MSEFKRLLLLPHIKVHNANALSSPFTIGFPAMTAWLGAVHALQRKLNAQGYSDIKFNSVAVVNHQCDLQTHKGVDDFVHSIIGTGNPLDKTGARSAFIEEARCHLEVSLVIEYTGIEKDDEATLQEKITHLLNCNMKIAGGDILTFKAPQFFKVESGNTTDLSALTRKLMPGYALIERRDLMIEAMVAGQDAMDALLDNLVIHHQCTKESNDSDDVVTWTSKRKHKGWIVPIATGFHGLTDLGEAKNQRDPNTPHRFAESVVTLGEFKMPHNIKSIDEILWRYQPDQTNNLYLCAQIQKITQTEQEIENAYYE
ncbi:type I-F CRISPR-associated protein Csy2 [Shewanella sp. BF02_Schw]|uniref:type I-F CRISPR-associated protein Csy2 n=1 Tax=Shewanella sp. BF02_Schw TaxID=394908 RepID=UPI00178401FC|nr:type I-F CRISPR-associated protein Csy2 [Shewanella sp. BF02_Schw]MBO1896915.1 type I-F CRISPR-associated protein Csy2 [Shewanella sp. BF02_Schw]